ncbi:MAG TPA: hypothetical protein ENJ21_04150 [Chromatiaceae bacterium]|nr:hypothetical protein [Chromatiaceae bacterium]
MIDMHSHILPGVDDGAQVLEDALEMLRIARADGVEVQVLTPHIHPDRYPNTRESLQQTFDRFQRQVADNGVDIELRLAAELRIGPELVRLANDDGLPWLGSWRGRHVMLMEFPHSSIPAGSENMVAWLIQRDILPMIAHPERNQALQSRPSKLDPFLTAGCLLQVTAGSLTGQFGAEARSLAESLLLADRVTLLATDAHNLAYRPPNLSSGVAAAARLIGEAAARRLVEENPRGMLEAA